MHCPHSVGKVHPRSGKALSKDAATCVQAPHNWPLEVTT